MIAAVYARKSTDQSAIADEAKSVTRQIAHARAYALGKGWRVSDPHVYADDAVSGAELARRPGVQRLRAALKPRAPFQVLIVSEQSRLSRDTSDTLQLLKELARAGVRVFAYQDDRAISLETPADTLFTTVNAWKDSEARRESSVRVHAALARKARAAHVTGSRCFGYRNRDVCEGTDAHGRPRRSHVRREIHEGEAAVVRRIFELCATGTGIKGTATILNEAGAPSPRAQQARRDGWAASTVRTVLHRELYRGVMVWNRTEKRNVFGEKQPHARNRSEWVRVEAPELRIVSDAAWEAAHARINRARRVYLAGTQGNLWGRPTSGTASKYLLTGIGRCGVCGGGLTVRSRIQGGRRVHRYVCATHHYRGKAICGNGLELRGEVVEAATLAAIEADVLRPSVIERAVRLALDALDADRPADRRTALKRELTRTEAELDRLAAGIAEGGALATLVGAMQAREAQADRLRHEIRTLDTQLGGRPTNRKAIEVRLRDYLADWRGLLHRCVGDARQILETLVPDRLVFTPTTDADGLPCYRVEGRFALGRILSGVIRSQGGTSPEGRLSLVRRQQILIDWPYPVQFRRSTRLPRPAGAASELSANRLDSF
jgi:site-specific DNA recombinase